MRRCVAVVCAAVMLSVPVFADVTITSTGSGKGLGMSANMQTVIYIKGNKMRTDTTVKGETYATVIDLDAQKMVQINVKKKEAEIYDMSKIGADVEKSVGSVTPIVKFAPNGQTKEILGKSCTGYDMSIEVAMAAGKEGPDDLRIVMSGPIWIAKGAPGARDFAGFYRAATQKGYFFNNPQEAKQGANTKAWAELYKSMIATGGLAYGQEIQIKTAGGGPVAGLMSKIGGMNMTTTVTEVKTDALSDDLFTVPMGFKQKVK